MKNYSRVFTLFSKNYRLVPLEVYKGPYKALISTILSARTRDETTLKVCRNLFKIAPDLKSLSNLTESEIKKLIQSVGFSSTKAKHLYKLAKMITKVPTTKKELINLPGVGGKTANLVLNRAFNTPAIAVDTHVHRITNLIGWVHTKTPQETEKELIKSLPQKYWADTNRLFVSIGQQYRSERKLKEFFKKNKLIN